MILGREEVQLLEQELEQVVGLGVRSTVIWSPPPPESAAPSVDDRLVLAWLACDAARVSVSWLVLWNDADWTGWRRRRSRRSRPRPG